MRVGPLVLKNFRNYADLEWHPHPLINIISGDNAQGKTNLLEAVFFCTAGRSFRTARDREIINWSEDQCDARVKLQKKEGSFEISVLLQKNGNNLFSMNGRKQNRSDIFQPCLAVSFTPADLDLISGGPSERRRWIDLELGPYHHQYNYNLEKFERVLFQRNNLLKSSTGRSRLAENLEPWNDQLFDYGSKIVEARIKLFKNIFPHLKDSFSILTSGNEDLSFNYLSSLPLEKGVSQSEIKTIYRDTAIKRLDDEINRRQTLIGPHRDDLMFLINKRDVKKFGSRGQQRSVSLAMKLSLTAMFYAEYGEYPAIILDDVFHELDSRRRKGLDSLLKGEKQVFLTSNNPLRDYFSGGRGSYRVEAGKIYEEEK